jgi:hypothetical protein
MYIKMKNRIKQEIQSREKGLESLGAEGTGLMVT